jgi:hypothetical protein
MHGSDEGMPKTVGDWLIKGTDPSSICLNCHYGTGAPESHHVASPDGSALTPGGDFYWLTKDFAWSNGTSPSETHGHNVTALDFGFTQDPTLLQAPGGSYYASDLGCNSCHDPHGQVQGGTAQGSLPIRASGSYGEVATSTAIPGNFRLLGDGEYDGGEQSGGYSFANDAPVAMQNPLEPFGERDGSHVDYGSGMSEWCANCHAGFYNNPGHPAHINHPSGDSVHLRNLADTYNAYVRTGDISGTKATAYLQFVPFERGDTDVTKLDPTSSEGPAGNSNVMCLTCHRAHASAFTDAGRWDLTVEYLRDSHPQEGDVGVTGNDVYYSYYGRGIELEFGTGQRRFCEKCHGDGF